MIDLTKIEHIYIYPDDYLEEINAEEGTPLDATVKYFKNIKEEAKHSY